MIIRQEVKDFEALGFGMFVHFGAYSVLAKGEWAKQIYKIPYEEYDENVKAFCPVEDWADRLVKTAKDAGCKYITLTTRHHDGFSLFDTCGLNDYDTMHTIGRDLVREYVDACRKYDVIPFFYHTLLDWHHPLYDTDFPAYLKYLRDSVEILCTKYGKIGGLWFDGKWNKPNDDWEEDALYGMIRSHQPHCIIINNTGLSARGEAGHIELDSVTFERGLPNLLNQEGAPKYLASEMCETLGEHWGYAKEDVCFESPMHFISEIAECRKYGANMLLNVGPKGDGTLRLIDQAILEIVGQWIGYNDEAIRKPRPTKISLKCENKKDFLLKDGNNYYLFCCDLPRSGDINVTIAGNPSAYLTQFSIPEKVKQACWLDNGEAVKVEQDGDVVSVHTVPFFYGCTKFIRVAKITVE